MGVLTTLLPSLATAAYLKKLSVAGIDSAGQSAAASTFTLMCINCNRPDALQHSGALCTDCAEAGQSPVHHCKVCDMKEGYLECHGDDDTCDREIALSTDSCWCDRAMNCSMYFLSLIHI